MVGEEYMCVHHPGGKEFWGSKVQMARYFPPKELRTLSPTCKEKEKRMECEQWLRKMQFQIC